jgi:hypothetical protein
VGQQVREGRKLPAIGPDVDVGYGRVVFDAPFHVSFEAGPHDVLHGDVDQLACSALDAQ